MHAYAGGRKRMGEMATGNDSFEAPSRSMSYLEPYIGRAAACEATTASSCATTEYAAAR
jgi:hypothetical protein